MSLKKRPNINRSRGQLRFYKFDLNFGCKYSLISVLKHLVSNDDEKLPLKRPEKDFLGAQYNFFVQKTKVSTRTAIMETR